MMEELTPSHMKGTSTVAASATASKFRDMGRQARRPSQASSATPPRQAKRRKQPSRQRSSSSSSPNVPSTPASAPQGTRVALQPISSLPPSASLAAAAATCSAPPAAKSSRALPLLPPSDAGMSIDHPLRVQAQASSAVGAGNGPVHWPAPAAEGGGWSAGGGGRELQGGLHVAAAGGGGWAAGGGGNDWPGG